MSIVRFVKPEEIRSPAIRQLHIYWESKRGGGFLPAKAAIDPGEIKPLLPFVTIVEIHRAPLRLRFRLVGTEVARNAAVDFTDRWIPDEAWDEASTTALLSVHQTLIEQSAPLFGIDELVRPDGRRHRQEWASFPLSQDGRTVTHAIGIVDDRHVVWD